MTKYEVKNLYGTYNFKGNVLEEYEESKNNTYIMSEEDWLMIKDTPDAQYYDQDHLQDKKRHLPRFKAKKIQDYEDDEDQSIELKKNQKQKVTDKKEADIKDLLN